MKNYLSEIKNIPILTREEERELLKKAKTGDEKAKEKLIVSNLRFVVAVSKKYQGQGMLLEDLIGEGNLGLCVALDKFNLNKDNKFITYAVWWIRHYILQALSRASSGSIRLPSNKQQLLIKVAKTKDRLEQDLGKTPTTDDIAEYLNINNELDIDILEGINYISLDSSYIEDGSPLTEIIADDRKDILEDYKEKALCEAVEDLLSSITDERERIILKYYHGIGLVRGHTLEEIGGLFNISRERIRQIKETVYEKIANSEKHKHLKNHLN